jgi:diguanylate cyclase (GGDEF)-like protein
MIDRLLADADRDAFTARLMQALEMAESERDVHAVVQRAMAQLAPELPMELLLAGQDQGALRVAAEHPRCGRAGCVVESPGSCVAIRRGATTVFEDSDALDACPRLRDRPGGPMAAICVPVTFMGRSLGVLHAAAPVRKAPGPRLVAQLGALGSQSGARIGAVRAFARASLHAYTDALTGLANRRALEALAGGLREDGRHFAFVLADLDHFKRLNDAHGHEVGDRALKLFAQVLREHVREDDTPARWGGEEFAIVFRGASAAQAGEVLERVRAGLAEALPAAGTPPFTASFGVAESAGARDFQQVVRVADQALYSAKAQGRDRVGHGVGTTLRQSSSLPLKMR